MQLATIFKRVYFQLKNSLLKTKQQGYACIQTLSIVVIHKLPRGKGATTFSVVQQLNSQPRRHISLLCGQKHTNITLHPAPNTGALQ
jgi:hypothetical protein